MKLQKLDQKQTPQVVVLVALVVGVFGYAGYSVISAAAPPKKKPTQARQAEEQPVRVAEAPRSVTEGPAGAAGAAAGVAAAESAVTAGGPVPSPIPGGAPLPSIYSPDPFRSLAPASSGTGRVAKSPSPSKPSASPSSERTRRMALGKLFGGLPGVEGAFPGLAGGGAEVRPAAPPPPVRPELELTGVIDAEKGGTDMALVIMDDQQRILQVGDKLPNNYRVAKIALDGVLLVNGKDRFFVAVGKKSEPAEQKTEDGAAAPAPSLRS